MSTLPSPTSTSTESIPGRTRALLGISLGYFMVLLDMTVLSVAEPDLAASLGSSIAGLQWVTTGYTISFAAFLLSAGAIADRYGAHRVFRYGTAGFGALSLLSAFAPDLVTLVALRVALGMAAAACVPASMAMIAQLYPEPARRARAIASWAAISGAAVAAGPIAGGALVGLAGWRSIFVVNAPIAVLVLALSAGAAVTCPRGEGRIDWPAQLAAAIVLALCTDALIAGGAQSWRHCALSAVGAVLATVTFALLEQRSTAPVLNRALLRSRRVCAGLSAGAAVNFALSGALFVLPLLLQQQRQLSPLHTGLAFLPLTVPFAVIPPFAGRLVARIGPARPILAGLSLLAAGGAVLGVAVFAAAGYPILATGLLLSGFGVAFALPALVAAIVNAAPAGTAGSVGGMLNAVRQVGATLGVAIMGMSAGTGIGWSLLISAGVCATAAALFAAAGTTG
ncbi:MFS transporter [Nocardia sp. NBC_00416]|uniref:MFS transporter n=1 Tax=Nocardia sp. NBC_00416 TaxID=2975991 RepID=UPI002E1F1999